MTIYDLLTQLEQQSNNTFQKGNFFEKVVIFYLKNDPQYSVLFSDVWSWSDFPYRWGADNGIDIVMREQVTGDYWACQCKFYAPQYKIKKEDIDSFFTESGKGFSVNNIEYRFTNRLIFATSPWGSNAEKSLHNQTIPVIRLGLKDLDDSPVDWSQFYAKDLQELHALKVKYGLRDYQLEAVDAVISGFASSERGRLIMACGTGKTITALRLVEELIPVTGKILFLAPSISLVSQTLREWTAQAITPIYPLAVCSDSKVGNDNEDLRVYDLAIPATTDFNKLVTCVQKVPSKLRTVIFSTYQSIQVIADAQCHGLGEFDLIICDEAHRTTGITLPNETPSEFIKVHDNGIVQGKKRLYMTATPRIYTDKSKTKAEDKEATLFSMDDSDKFGTEFYRLGFSKAAELKILSEYKVLIVAVDERMMANFSNMFTIDNDKQVINMQLATKIIGSWKGLSKQDLKMVGQDGSEEAASEDLSPMRRAIAFSRSIKDSKELKDIFSKLVNAYTKLYPTSNMISCELDHVDGTMNSLTRQRALGWLKANSGNNNCRILSNSRCLSEGIDIPTLDAVIFFDTKESVVDIIQAVGRVMRKPKPEGDSKKLYGYVILPVCIPTQDVKDYNQYIESNVQFKGIWKVLKALRAHDESLVDDRVFREKIKIQVVVDPNPVDGGTSELKFPELPLEAIAESVYSAIPKKLGDREYWSEWAKNVSVIAANLMARITTLLNRVEARVEFDAFLKGLRDNLNPAVTETEAIEMLAQHIITRPIFDALFEDYSFAQNNPVSRAMQAVIELLDDRNVGTETEDLTKFYTSIRQNISVAKSDKSRQNIIRNLYDTFFNNTFPRLSERLGIVYTPIEVVDFIIKSADVALRRHFNTSLSDSGVQVLDPFTGTGTFIVRLLQSGLIHPEDLVRKYKTELHANEIVLLAYYIAAINIESIYHELTGHYQPFAGIVLTDTFQMNEKHDLVNTVVLPENSAQVRLQKQQNIQVIIGNPPYSAGQASANDNNQNLKYESLDTKIRETYANQSTATNKNSLYDSYIRGIRWASDRIGDKGIVAFVTNGSFLDGNAADGLRKSLTNEFSQIYLFNLRGNQRTSGEESRKEGGKIFGSGSRTPVVITILVKDPVHTEPCQLYYHDIGDSLTREQKLAIIEGFGSIEGVNWETLTPNDAGDWINQRNPTFETFIELGNKVDKSTNTIFSTYSRGIATSRDAWVYNFSHDNVASNVRRMIKNYNTEVSKYKVACQSATVKLDLDNFITDDSKCVSWSRGLKTDLERGITHKYLSTSVVPSMYRPFTKEWVYFNSHLNDMTYQMPKLFPTPDHENIVISATGTGASKLFSALATKTLPDLELISKGQCFPLYYYEKGKDPQQEQGALSFDIDTTPKNDGYIRHDAITDWALDTFRAHYQDQTISKEDIFWYVYGMLHSQEYVQRFASDLKKMLPRIPLSPSFWIFSNAGRSLGDIHVNYETVAPYNITEDTKRLVMEDNDYTVEKMSFGKKDGKPDKSVIAYNSSLTLRDIPLQAYNYVVNGKSAIEWVMERYTVSVDKESQIKNNANDWSDDPRYIVDLIRRVVRVSIETVKIVEGLPKIDV